MSDDDTLRSIADELVLCTADPVCFVETMFDWQSPELKGAAPEPWQREVLCGVRDGLPLGKAVRIAVASGHGVGKTALVSWLVLWAISTCKDCRGILTASNEAQLHTRNRAELRKWYRLFRGRAFFELTATALISADSGHEQTWRIDLLPWNEHRPESFAGLHNQGKRVLVIMDEAFVIPPIIWQTIEPVMTDVNTEIVWAVFGNPLHSVGPFRECFGRFAHRFNRYNLPVEDIQFGGRASNATSQVRYAQKRSEMWGSMRDALKYLAIPNSAELRDQLISPEYDFNLAGCLQLEKKSDMKRRGLASPDIADALALTFARPVMQRQYDDWFGGSNVVSEYDPFAPEKTKPPRYYAPGWARLRDDEGDAA
jgi:hypothetical protein